MYIVPLLGVITILYALAVITIAIKKPDKIWKMKKIAFLRKALGEANTVIFFYIWGAGFLVLGCLLMAEWPFY